MRFRKKGQVNEINKSNFGTTNFNQHFKMSFGQDNVPAFPLIFKPAISSNFGFGDTAAFPGRMF